MVCESNVPVPDVWVWLLPKFAALPYVMLAHDYNERSIGRTHSAQDALSCGCRTTSYTFTASDLLLTFCDVVEGLAVNGLASVRLGLCCRTTLDRVLRA